MFENVTFLSDNIFFWNFGLMWPKWIIERHFLATFELLEHPRLQPHSGGTKIVEKRESTETDFLAIYFNVAAGAIDNNAGKEK